MSDLNFKYFPYLIQSIVEDVRSEYDPEDNMKPYFEFGTYLELTKQIEIKDDIDAEKYPLIWLVWEADESIQQWTSKIAYTISPRLFICNFTSSDYSSSERYDLNFIEVLFPIWNMFLKYLEYFPYVTTDTTFPFQLAEHLLWGETLGFEKNKNIMFDTLDAIEIKFSKLEINNIC